MKMLLTTIVALFAISAASARPSMVQAPAACDAAALPAPVNELLKSKFAGWRPEHVADLEGNDQKLWLEAHPKECPGIAVGHFESAGSLSYAVLLVPVSERVSGYQIVVFSKEPNADSYALRVLDHREGKDYFAPVIYKVPPGKYTGFDDSKSVLLKLDGVNVEWIEKSSFIYYWWGGRYRKIWTSD
jgi:hypothetical protein